MTGTVPPPAPPAPPGRTSTGDAVLPRSDEGKRARLTRAKFDRAVVTLMLAGADTDSICEALSKEFGRKITPRRVTAAIRRVIDRWGEENAHDVEELRRVQVKQIDRLIQAHWADAIGSPGKSPSIKATAEIRKLQALKARLTGTEAPKKVEVGGTIGIELEREEADQLDRIWSASGGDVIEGTATEIEALPPAPPQR